jgi:hypothetical protein
MDGRFCENRVLRRMIRCKRGKVTRSQRTLCSKEFNNFSSLSIVRMILFRRPRWAKHEAYTRDDETGFWIEKLKEGHHLRDLDARRRIVLKMVLEKRFVQME